MSVARLVRRRWEHRLRDAGAEPWVAREIVGDLLVRHSRAEVGAMMPQFVAWAARVGIHNERRRDES